MPIYQYICIHIYKCVNIYIMCMQVCMFIYKY